MAQIKISELTALAEIEDTDVLAGVDTSNASTVKIPAIYLKQYINKEQDDTLTELAENIETNTENIETNTENIETNTDNISENKASIKSNTSRIKRIESNLYDSGVENGSAINVQDSTLAEFQEVSVDGVCKQVTTTGASLIDFSNPYTVINATHTYENDTLTITTETTKTYDGLRYDILEIIKNNPGKTLRLDIESANESNPIVTTSIGTLQLVNNGSSVFHTFIGRVSDNYVPSSAYYTIPEDVSRVTTAVLNIFTNNSNIRPDVSNVVTIKKPIFHFGTEKIDFEPYTGGQASPRPDWQQPISVIEEDFNVKSVGKNIFDNTKLNGYKGATSTTTIDTGVRATNTTDGIATPFATIVSQDLTNSVGSTIRMKAEISVSAQNTGRYALGLVSADGKNRISEVFSTNSNEEISFVVPKLDKTTKYLGVWFYPNLAASGGTAVAGDYVDFTNVVVTIDNEDLTYEPYQESKIEIPMPNGEFAGKLNETYKDQFQIKWNDDEKEYWLYLKKLVGKYVVTGDENIVKSNVDRADRYGLPISVDQKLKTALTNIGFDGICNYYRTHAGTPSELGYVWKNTTHTSIYFEFAETGTTTINDFKTKAKELYNEGKPLLFYYRLTNGTDYEIPIMPVEMLLTYLGQTNVFTDSELNPNMLVKYYREFVATIRNLQVNNGTLQGELADVQTRLSALETSLNNLLVSQVSGQVSGQVESEVVE